MICSAQTHFWSWVCRLCGAIHDIWVGPSWSGSATLRSYKPATCPPPSRIGACVTISTFLCHTHYQSLSPTLLSYPYNFASRWPLFALKGSQISLTGYQVRSKQSTHPFSCFPSTGGVADVLVSFPTRALLPRWWRSGKGCRSPSHQSYCLVFHLQFSKRRCVLTA